MKSKSKYSFGKNEKLKRSGQIKKILERGKVYKSTSFNCIYTFGNEKKIAVIVPKKKIRLATDRNLLKRRIREAYRLNKHLLYLDLMIIFFYKDNKITSFESINLSMIDALLKLSEIY